MEEIHPDDLELLHANREKMLVSADHLLSLINDMLQMSKLENNEIVLAQDAMDLNALLMDVVTIVEQRAADAGITLEYDKTSDKVLYPYVYGSPLHVRQIFLNRFQRNLQSYPNIHLHRRKSHYASGLSWNSRWDGALQMDDL